MANTNYTRNYTIATARAAKVTGVPVEDVRKFYRNVAKAPKGVKRAAILAHRIMDKYGKPAVVESETAPAEVPAAE